MREPIAHHLAKTTTELIGSCVACGGPTAQTYRLGARFGFSPAQLVFMHWSCYEANALSDDPKAFGDLVRLLQVEQALGGK